MRIPLAQQHGGETCAVKRFAGFGWLAARKFQKRRQDVRVFNDGFRAWTTSNASIGAKIQAYFGKNLGAQWRSFANVVTDYFQLSATPGSGRAEQVHGAR